MNSQFDVVDEMQGIMEAHNDPALKCALKTIDLFVPDGAPMVWLVAWHDFEVHRPFINGHSD